MRSLLHCAFAIVAMARVGGAETPAQAFALYPFESSPSLLPQAARWVEGFGLEDGIQVGVEAGFETALGIETPERRRRL